MIKILLGIVLVIVLAVGGKSYYKSQQAQKTANLLAEQKRNQELQAELDAARAKREETEAKLALVEAEKQQQAQQQVIPSSQVVPAASSGSPVVESTEDVRKNELQSSAITAVRGVLKDPGSANFKITKVGIDVASLNGTRFNHVCGEVNAKNSFGGYTGFKRFYWDANVGPKIEGNELHEILLKPLWENWCS